MIPTNDRTTTREGLTRRRRSLAALMVVLAAGTWLGPGRAMAAAPEYEPEERATALSRAALVYVSVEWSGIAIDNATGSPLAESGPLSVALGCSGFVANPDGVVVTAGLCLDPAAAFPALLDRLATASGMARAGLESSVGIAGLESSAPGGDRRVHIGRGPVFPGAASPAVEGLAAGPPRDPATAEVIADGGGSAPGSVALLRFSPTDLAAPGATGVDFPALALAPAAEVGKGDPVVALGYPAERNQLDRTKVINPVDRWSTVAERPGTGQDTFEIAGLTMGALKGGPVVDMEGRVVGIAGIGPDGLDESAAVISTGAIERALGQAGVTNRTGPTDDTYRAALNSFYAGDFRTALGGFNSLTGEVAREDAAVFGGRAANLLELQADHGRGTPVLIVLVILLIGGATFLVLRNRSRPPAA